jgi:16S rRNA (guanine527-N7)-methyltransferase
MTPDKGPGFGAETFQRNAGVSRETLDRLALYHDLLQKWAPAINLVGKESLSDAWRRHFWDSAQVFPLLPPPPPSRALRLVDLGSGAGFPGLVLAIMGAVEVHLVESDMKKCSFLREAARITGTEVTIWNRRIEGVEPLHADVVTARALAPLARLIGLAKPHLKPTGLGIFLKGRGVEQELTAIPKGATLVVDKVPSRSDPDSTILVVGGISG